MMRIFWLGIVCVLVVMSVPSCVCTIPPPALTSHPTISFLEGDTYSLDSDVVIFAPYGVPPITAGDTRMVVRPAIVVGSNVEPTLTGDHWTPSACLFEPNKFFVSGFLSTPATSHYGFTAPVLPAQYDQTWWTGGPTSTPYPDTVTAVWTAPGGISVSGLLGVASPPACGLVHHPGLNCAAVTALTGWTGCLNGPEDIYDVYAGTMDVWMAMGTFDDNNAHTTSQSTLNLVDTYHVFTGNLFFVFPPANSEASKSAASLVVPTGNVQATDASGLYASLNPCLGIDGTHLTTTSDVCYRYDMFGSADLKLHENLYDMTQWQLRACDTDPTTAGTHHCLDLLPYVTHMWQPAGFSSTTDPYDLNRTPQLGSSHQTSSEAQTQTVGQLFRFGYEYTRVNPIAANGWDYGAFWFWFNVPDPSVIQAATSCASYTTTACTFWLDVKATIVADATATPLAHKPTLMMLSKQGHGPHLTPLTLAADAATSANTDTPHAKATSTESAILATASADTNNSAGLATASLSMILITGGALCAIFMGGPM